MFPTAITPVRAAVGRLPLRICYLDNCQRQTVRFAHCSAVARRPVVDLSSSSRSAQLRLQQVIRYSSTMASQKNEYMVVVNDKPGTLEKRLEVRKAHLDNLGPVLDSGFLKLGGAMFDHHPKEGETPPFKGSMLVVVAESEQEIRETLSKDIYATSGVWDVDNMQITPFKSAIRLPL